ncbi:methylated-DNA--[protein]-cysteine S-methyltransferase [Parageobacillus thermoglucosidasius]|uniref:Methylated-DNA--protein-cysteine methyltransferase n=2 Tax=Anoxybacillaceae TaxID=3120669 RepID=A0AAN1D712_PARTM|nr:methylated-DNA--[protein]-cysteine S-methyltransferase [Parageobacillus thermoglucosidasius]REK54149.1 MAG: methylated-DNA--[protein]-cysteine S-methyltransferase [Geobacillus sp.]AEH48097.1 methylated-DNA/protein-cysteine methyltransferase [Parageobacillus thermoglucosidasius C56-YS93]ALF10671.1 cysteine methyltransferase [Parageobacillus thermoglucosidasius]ANZ30749.1 cysteine methyltransferase [Parageobacillus thermoglucosidasius]APM81487.1 cysteine methyltransferase [Parageobacillus the
MVSKNNLTVYWTLFVYNQWQMYIAATSKGLCYIGSPNKPFEELANWVTKRFPNSVLAQDDEKLRPYTDELEEYFRGKRKNFLQPLDLYGTPFQLSVWNALRKIPYGHTQSYSEIADYIQKPASVRAVGAAIGANPILIVVPCHRAIGKNGKLTGYRGGLEIKKQLLQLESRSLLMEASPLHA